MTPGERACKFIENLTLTDDFDGEPFRLRPWQRDEIIVPTFGTIRPDGRRRYRRVFLFLPRKQAKTQLASSIGMYGLKGTGKTGEQVICAASDIDQASHIFHKCERMIDNDPWLSRSTRVYRSARRIEDRKSDNFLQVVSSDGRRQHGLNPSILLFDELHTQPNRELYNALTSAQQTRKEPLVILISTAGNDLDSLCHDEYEYAKKVQDNPEIDPTYLPIIYEADPKDDIYDESTWFKAMPALGDFCELDFIRSEFVKARESPGEESKCKQFYLNLWTPKATKWLPVENWRICGEFPVVPTDFDDRVCYAGLDASNVSDISAFVFGCIDDDGFYKVGCRFWIPEESADKIDKSRGTRYRKWADEGWIRLTSGDTIDHDLIIEEVIELTETWDFKEIRMDRQGATQIAVKLTREGINATFMHQGTMSMNEPVKFLEALLSKGRLHHGDNPILNMMARNVVQTTGQQGNVKFDKDVSDGKIDGMVSLAMMVGAAMLGDDWVEGSIATV